ncbi:MAG: ABC transporter permease subunit [Candidatus Latescibacterota bacterium]
MLFLIIRKEIVHNVLSFRFTVTYALLFGLVLLALFLMGSNYQARFEEYTTAAEEQRAKVAELGKIEDPSKLFEEYQRASFSGVREPHRLSLLALGLDDVLPSQVPGSGYMRWVTSEDRLSTNLLFRLFQAPDFAYVVNVVMSLLALMFVFDAVCGEKEQGTLKLLLSNSVPRDLVLVGKWLGGLVCVTVPFLAAGLAGYVYGSVSGALGGEGAGTRYLSVFLVSLLYVSAFFTLGLMISTIAHRSSTALLASLMVWVCWILVVPNVAPITARLLAPVPGRQVIEAEKQAIGREGNLLQEAIRKRKVYGDQQEAEKIQQETERRQQKLEAFYQERMQTQVGLTQNLARLSPSASYLFAATRLAGTGPELARGFQQARERFQEEHSKRQGNLWQTLQQSGRITFTNGRVEVKDRDWFQPEDLPRFRILVEDLTTSLDQAAFDLLLLVVFNVLFFMLAFVFFLRYDVT